MSQTFAVIWDPNTSKAFLRKSWKAADYNDAVRLRLTREQLLKI